MIVDASRTRALLIFALLVLAGGDVSAELVFPGESWQRYDDPSAYGWSPDRLAAARRRAEGAGVASYMIVEGGYVVDAWGDVTRRYKCHSVRKSFLSALVGIHAARGEIDPAATIGELGIDDVEALTAGEKSATVADLLKARSGVYHPAAYETAKMAALRPDRGSREPGTWYYYNNWDFNTLGAIFIQETGLDLFAAFRDDIAGPVGMRDFRMIDTYYHLEADESRFPAYPFMLSTRDAARFGLLYLAGGRWEEAQVVPESWVEASRTAYSPGVRKHRGYGLLWWVSEEPALARIGMYHAAGVGGQIIAVLPGMNLVIVQRVDTFLGHAVPYRVTLELMKEVVAAKVREADLTPVSAVPLIPQGNEPAPLGKEFGAALSGTYSDRRGNAVMTLGVDSADHLLLAFRYDEEEKLSRNVRKFNSGQRFRIIQGADGRLMIESAEFPIELAHEPDGSVSRMTIETPDGPVTLLRGQPAVDAP